MQLSSAGGRGEAADHAKEVRTDLEVPGTGRNSGAQRRGRSGGAGELSVQEEGTEGPTESLGDLLTAVALTLGWQGGWLSKLLPYDF